MSVTERDDADQGDLGDLTIYVDGAPVSIDDMTFRERREVRALARELNEDPDSDDINVDDAVMAMIVVAKRRKTPGYDVEQVLDERLTDYLRVPPTSPTSSGGGKAGSAGRTTPRKSRTA